MKRKFFSFIGPPLCLSLAFRCGRAVFLKPGKPDQRGGQVASLRAAEPGVLPAGRTSFAGRG